MIGIVTPDSYAAYGRALSEMHRLRYRVFKERLGWEVRSDEGEERDEFDDLGPVYILAFDGQDLLLGSLRLLPTTGPNMLRDVFPQLLGDYPMPADPLVWECSRFAVDHGAAGDNSLSAVNRATQELFCGLIEYCMAEGIRAVIAVYDVRTARLLPQIGCRPKWRTRPQRIGNTSARVGLFETSPTVLDEVRAMAGIAGSVICAPYPIRRSKVA